MWHSPGAGDNSSRRTDRVPDVAAVRRRCRLPSGALRPESPRGRLCLGAYRRPASRGPRSRGHASLEWKVHPTALAKGKLDGVDYFLHASPIQKIAFTLDVGLAGNDFAEK